MQLQATNSLVFEHYSYAVQEKKLTLFTKTFNIYDPLGNLVLIVKLKPFTLKTHIYVYAANTQEEFLYIKGNNIFNFLGSFDVYTSTNQDRIGVFKRELGYSWTIKDKNGAKIGVSLKDEGIRRPRFHRTLGLEFAIYANKTKICSYKFLNTIFRPVAAKLTMDFSRDYPDSFDKKLCVSAAILICLVEGNYYTRL